MSVMERPKIVIIGAGLSGISAAQTLIKKGFTNVQILEANDRVGGRIHTQQYGKEINEVVTCNGNTSNGTLCYLVM